MKLRKVMALTLAGAMTAATLTACGGGADETTAAAAGADKETTAAAEEKETTAAAADSGSADAEVVLQVAFENSITEPVGHFPAVHKELEALCILWIFRLLLCKGKDLHRVVHDKGGLYQVLLYKLLEEQV